MLIIKKGDLFTSNDDCIVNTVNSIGVMGKGVALAFIKKYPNECEAFNKYSVKVQSNRAPILLKPKYITLNTLYAPKYILFFPTKIHWRNPSKLEYIEKNLPLALDIYTKLGVKSVSTPWPGCGNGGLDKNDVRKIFDKYISKFNGTITIYESE